jgi:putative FmdB family regulatory protein
MPIHEYACARCHESFEEILVRKSDEDDVRCPKCKSRKVQRLMSRPAAARVGGGGGGASRPAPACGPVG